MAARSICIVASRSIPHSRGGQKEKNLHELWGRAMHRTPSLACCIVLINFVPVTVSVGAVSSRHCQTAYPYQTAPRQTARSFSLARSLLSSEFRMQAGVCACVMCVVVVCVCAWCGVCVCVCLARTHASPPSNLKRSCTCALSTPSDPALRNFSAGAPLPSQHQ